MEAVKGLVMLALHRLAAAFADAIRTKIKCTGLKHCKASEFVGESFYLFHLNIARSCFKMYICIICHIYQEINKQTFLLSFSCCKVSVDFLCFSVLCLLCVCACLFIWSPAGKGLTSWLSFVVYNCEFVTFPLVSWVRCGT